MVRLRGAQITIRMIVMGSIEEEKINCSIGKVRQASDSLAVEQKREDEKKK
jgi:hypothetical protein